MNEVLRSLKEVSGIKAVDEDLMFHFTIAECSKDKVLKSLLLIIIPDIISNYSVFKVYDTVTSKASNEYKQLFACVRDGDVDKGVTAMKKHLKL